MESLLSLSFDYLSSFDTGKIRKGLRQLEGLLAQICLSRSGNSPSTAAEKRRSVAVGSGKDQIPKELAQLKNDPAFREFFKLQEGFEWNGKHMVAIFQVNFNLHYSNSRNQTCRVPRAIAGKRQQYDSPHPHHATDQRY